MNEHVSSCPRRERLNLLEQPAHRAFLNFDVLWNPHRMDGVAYSREYDSALSKVIGPSRDGFRSQLFIHQAVHILRLQNDVLAILIVLDIVLLIVDHERFQALSNGMPFSGGAHPKWPQRGMTDISSAHHVPVVFGAQRNMTRIVKSIEAITSRHEFFDGGAL